MSNHIFQTIKGGSLALHIMLQQDRIITPFRRELVMHDPLVMMQENAETICNATLVRGSEVLQQLLRALEQKRLDVAVVSEHVDMGAPNVKAFRYLRGFIKQFRTQHPDAGRVLVRLVRCDGHQLHMCASISLTRSAVSSPLFSAGNLVRAGSSKFHMFHAAETIAQEELDWSQGGEPNLEHRAYARAVLERTVLRHTEAGNLTPGSAAAKRRQEAEICCEGVVDFFNLNWKIRRVGHRCKVVLLPNGTLRFCCANRFFFVCLIFISPTDEQQAKPETTICMHART